MPPKTATASLSDVEIQVLYSVIDNVSKDFTNMVEAKKAVLEQFENTNGGRKLTEATLNIELKRMAGMIGGSARATTIFKEWTKHKDVFIPSQLPSKPKLTLKAAQQTPDTAPVEAADSDEGAVEDPKPASVVPKANERKSKRARTGDDNDDDYEPEPEPRRKAKKSKSVQETNAQPEVNDSATSTQAKPDAAPVVVPAQPEVNDSATNAQAKPDAAQVVAPAQSYVPPSGRRLDFHGIVRDAMVAVEEEHKERRAEEAAESLNGPNAKPPTTTFELEPKEAKFIQDLRGLKNNTSAAYWSGPDPNDISVILETSLQEIGEGIRCFLEAHPNAILSSVKMTAGAGELTKVLVGKEEWDRSGSAVLEALADSPGTSVQLILQAYAAAAVHKWVFVDFDDLVKELMASGNRDVYNMMSKYHAELFRDFSVYNDIQYLEDVVKPTLPLHARKFERDLFEAFRSICSSQALIPASQDDDFATAKGFFSRIEHYRAWQKLVTSAFTEMLELNLKMHKGPFWQYSVFPATGTKFETRHMEIADKSKDVLSEESAVYLCLSPKIMSTRRKFPNAPHGPIVAARVLVKSKTDRLQLG